MNHSSASQPRPQVIIRWTSQVGAGGQLTIIGAWRIRDDV